MTRQLRTCGATHSELLMDGQYVQICSIATQSSILLLSVYFFFYDHKRYQEVSPRILGMLYASADFRSFFGIYYDQR